MSPLRVVRAISALALGLLLPPGALAADLLLPSADPPTQRIELEELWRVGGDSEADEEFFGLLRDLTVDARGDVYLLDRQLEEIRVFSADGEYLRTLGRGGEGPGEFRRPSGMLWLPDGSLGVHQGAPPRIARVDPSGEPLDDLPLGPYGAAGDRVAMGVFRRSGGFFVHGLTRLAQESRVEQTIFLERWDGGEAAGPRLHEKHELMEFGHIVVEEAAFDGFRDRWALDPDGGLYLCHEFLPYAIQRFDAQGRSIGTIRREIEPRVRNDRELRLLEAIYGSFLRRWPPGTEWRVSEHDKAIEQVHCREDGRLWVLTSRGAWDRPEGSLGVFDIVDPTAGTLRRVELRGQGDPRWDRYVFAGDRLFVLRHQLAAQLSQVGAREGLDLPEAEPMELICYRLAAGAAANR